MDLPEYYLNNRRLESLVEYQSSFTLHMATLSKEACMSASHFHRVFKNELGIPPVEFINNERVKLAVSLLQNPQISIKEVYMCCGFESRSYFNRVFKSKQHFTPGDYQRLLQRSMF